MTDAEFDVASAVLFLEDQAADLHTMLCAFPIDAFPANEATWSRLRKVAVSVTSMYLTAHAYSEGAHK